MITFSRRRTPNRRRGMQTVLQDHFETMPFPRLALPAFARDRGPDNVEIVLTSIVVFRLHVPVLVLEVSICYSRS
jgi:hypothetical protein